MTKGRKEGHVVWLTGISGAGKTTLGKAVYEDLRGRGIPCEFLDGDIVRDFFEGDLGYSRKDRIANIRRITFAAKLLADNGITVVVANIAPYMEVRDFIRRKLDRYCQIFVDAPLDEVKRRDVKGLYKKFADGAMDNLIAGDDAYETPRNPDLVLDTGKESVEESLAKIDKFLKEKGIIQ